jgi:hypothetical protein
MSQLLLSKISHVRHRHASVAMGSGIALAVGALVLGLMVGMLLDWWLDLPRWIRAAFLAMDLSLLAVIVIYEIILPIVTAPNDDQIALQVEDAHPEFRTRLIASVQLSRPEAIVAGASPSLIHAMVAQTESLAETIDFGNVIRTDRLSRLGLTAAFMLLIGVAGLLSLRRDHIGHDLLSRAFLGNVEVPRKTRIDVVSGYLKLGRGDTANLVAKARGVVPSHGTVDIKFGSGRKQSFSLEPTIESTDSFARALENVQDSFWYRVHLGDNTTQWYRADVLIPPVVTRLECLQVFPAYTKRGTVARSLGDLSILNGSRLILKLTSNNALRLPAGVPGTSTVHLVNPQHGDDLPVTIDPADPHQATAEIALPVKTSGFSIRLVDTNGLTSRDPAVYRVDLIADKEPTVQISYPERKEELVTRVATLEVGFDAADDFGIAKLALKYKIDDGDVRAIPLDVAKAGEAAPKSLHKRYVWALSKLTPRSATQPTLEGSTIEYWLEAIDNNDVTGPGVGESEHYSARVVSEAEKRAEILARLGSSIQDVQRGVDDQDKLHGGLRDLILERKPE